MRTQIAIVGAGPAGLLLGRLLDAAGIETVILEARSRDYVQRRLRAGQFEYPTVQLLGELGLDDRMNREGVAHEGIELRFGGRRHRIPFAELTGGQTVTMYGQQELVKDLIAARLGDGRPLEFETTDVAIHGIDTPHPSIDYRRDGHRHTVHCDFVVGCDGWHGVSRPTIPANVLRTFEITYPFGWLGILAESPPTSEVVYAPHERGFALHSRRTPRLSRFYLQVPADESLEAWPDSRIWDELRTRMGDGDDDSRLSDGPILQRAITPMRSCVCEPMQYGSLFLAGDAAHIVPPSAAKGMNMAVSDVRVLSDCLIAHYQEGDRDALAGYSQLALPRVWWAQEFSRQVTWLLHQEPGDQWAGRLRSAALHHLCDSRAAMTAFSEQYVGLAFARLPSRLK